MKRFLLSISLFFSVVLTFAQGLITETFHLKNGSIVTGVVVEYVPNKTYTIMTADGNKFVFAIEDIEKVTRQTASTTTSSAGKSKSPINSAKLFEPGYHGVVETGLGAGMGTFGIDIFKLDFINGHRFNENLFVGGGIGLRAPREGDFPTFIPVFANGRYNLKANQPVSPVASMSVGAVFNSADGLNNGGLIINPSVGVLINKFSNFMLHASLGYDLMHVTFASVKYDINNPWAPPVLVRKIHFSEAFVFNIGVNF